MTDLYCVFGNPIAHSKSPAIHATFAAQTGQDLRYEARLAPVDDFAGAVAAFVREGGRGANVTVPFKEDAYRLATRRTARAEAAGAVNLLVFEGTEIVGDNSDGAGLLRDLELNLGHPLQGRRVLLLGAGGAARGALGPLLAARPAALALANRTPEKARALAAAFSDQGAVDGLAFADLTGRNYDVIINATAASLAGELPPLPDGLLAPAGLAYDMMYGRGTTPFLAWAQAQGAGHCADGLGMLVEQAAEAFHVWRGVRPESAPVLAALRAQLSAA